jgi:hypothetical protein
VTASFVDAKGQTLKDASGQPFSEKLVLHDNVAAEVSLPADEILPAGEDSMLFRAALQETPDPETGSHCCALTLTMEVIHSGGLVSDWILPRSPNPPWPFCVAVVGTQVR